MSTVCLTMIVKNEADVIGRCLSSALPVCDAYCIVDTGSTDETHARVRDAVQGMPGSLYSTPFVDFAATRTLALDLAAREHCDYLLLLDADHVLGHDDPLPTWDLTADCYEARLCYGSLVYHWPLLIRASLPWHYVGVVHEYLACAQVHSTAFLDGVWQETRRDGARSHDPIATARADAQALEAAVALDPEDSRSQFYLAQSYRDAQEYDRAIAAYQRRIVQGGYPEEVWQSLYQIARVQEQDGRPWPVVLFNYLACYQMDPRRAEPLARIAARYARTGEHALANLFFQAAHSLPLPTDVRLFLEPACYAPPVKRTA